MKRHTIFYYPYGSFQDAQAPLLKATAVYFDKLYILDPEKATGGSIGIGEVNNDIKLLEQKGLLERVAPEEVLHADTIEHAIAEAVRADVRDTKFIELCESSGRAHYWTLALAKVPHDLRNDPKFQPLDASMKNLLGGLPSALGYTKKVSSQIYDETEWAQALSEGYPTETVIEPLIKVYDEVRASSGQKIEYRYAEYPLVLGEAIMVNHALFASLLHKGATPLTDDPFHHEVLKLKMKRARSIPAIRQLLEDRAAKENVLALSTLTDTQLNLPSLSPQLHLDDILEYREKHAGELQQARERMAWLARQLEQTPWTKAFEAEIEHKAIPGIAKELGEVKKARDSWLNSKRGSLALKAAGITVGVASTIVSLIVTPSPLLPVTLGLVGSALIPGLGVFQDWIQGKKEAGANGLHYFLKLEAAKRDG
jgi:hypothetical protein